MNTFRMLMLGGDGIGPEVVAQARRVAEWFVERRGLALELVAAPYGASAWAETGHVLPPGTLEAVESADAILFGAIGGDAYERIPADARRDGSILRIRRELDLYANLRPVRHWPALAAACPLREEVAAGADLALVRENTGGLYFGQPRGIESLGDGRAIATNTQRYSSDEIERVARFAFELARTRRGEVCSVDKSNVLETGMLWRRTVQALHARRLQGRDAVAHAGRQLRDAARAGAHAVRRDRHRQHVRGHPVRRGRGDRRLARHAALGVARSRERRAHAALYEPVHGSAPDIEGRGVANPLGAILSLALALPAFAGRAGRGAAAGARGHGRARGGARTADIAVRGEATLTSAGMGDAVLRALDASADAPARA